jgi:hypothetical protein
MVIKQGRGTIVVIKKGRGTIVVIEARKGYHSGDKAREGYDSSDKASEGYDTLVKKFRYDHTAKGATSVPQENVPLRYDIFVTNRYGAYQYEYATVPHMTPM